MNLPTIHEVKSWPDFFQPLIDGLKLHDLRRNTDRDFTVGDYLFHREFDPSIQQYTGRTALSEILYVTDDSRPCAYSEIGIVSGFAILSIGVRAVNDQIHIPEQFQQ